jgi:hypothetical protein
MNARIVVGGACILIGVGFVLDLFGERL